jgi:hypothetical protein
VLSQCDCCDMRGSEFECDAVEKCRDDYGHGQGGCIAGPRKAPEQGQGVTSDFISLSESTLLLELQGLAVTPSDFPELKLFMNVGTEHREQRRDPCSE